MIRLKNMIITKNKYYLIPKTRTTIEICKKKTSIETLQMIFRLLIQNKRRPSNLIINLIQPLLWLLLFGALFQNAPISLFENYNVQYKEFLHPGIIIFTGFILKPIRFPKNKGEQDLGELTDIRNLKASTILS